ncbi:hypothetical protein SEA_UZUMAKI_77 [Arthrobacter phage Uzumaki]|nr:hypothetical protein SEA_UZUMAKI_77 [Arthrobacter phage Uzumaki]
MANYTIIVNDIVVSTMSSGYLTGKTIDVLLECDHCGAIKLPEDIFCARCKIGM